MKTVEEMLDEIENANNGDGPEPVATVRPAGPVGSQSEPLHAVPAVLGSRFGRH